MEVKPVIQIEKPKYPLKTELNEEELKKQIPKRWASSPAAKIALGTLTVMTLTGCVMAGGLTEVTLKTEASASAIDAMPMGEVLAPRVMVAPLFEHGGGSGAFGCIMIAPPVFLSEEEALTIINEAAKEYGLNFSTEDTPEFSNVLQPVTNVYHPLPKDSGAEQIATDTPDKIVTLKADFSDNEYGIAIEFVSTNDVESWNQSEANTLGGAYATLDAAAQLSEALESAFSQEGRDYTAGILYDPCARVEPKAGEMPSGPDLQSYVLAKEQLKAQAKDFFEWLKSQGVI